MSAHVLSSRERRAAHGLHTCWCCGGSIASGDRYLDLRMADGGDDALESVVEVHDRHDSTSGHRREGCLAIVPQIRLPANGELSVAEINFIAWDSFAEHTHLVRQLERLAEAGLVSGRSPGGVLPRKWELTYAGAAHRHQLLCG